jgi:hypothetical protein
MSDYDRFRKYIPEDEEILAFIKSEPILGTVNGYYCATERRLGELWKDGLFSWSYRSGEWEVFRRVEIEEGLVGCSIVFTLNKKKKNDEFDTMRIPNVPKDAGRRFVSVASHCILQNRELIANQTKTCPDCAETVKWQARKCKHCGYIFD